MKRRYLDEEEQCKDFEYSKFHSFGKSRCSEFIPENHMVHFINIFIHPDQREKLQGRFF